MSTIKAKCGCIAESQYFGSEFSVDETACKCGELSAENASLRAALEAVEFLWFYDDSLSFDGPSGNYCPFCWGVEKHKPKCQRQSALGLQP